MEPAARHRDVGGERRNTARARAKAIDDRLSCCGLVEQTWLQTHHINVRSAVQKELVDRSCQACIDQSTAEQAAEIGLVVAEAEDLLGNAEARSLVRMRVADEGRYRRWCRHDGMRIRRQFLNVESRIRIGTGHRATSRDWGT